MTFSSDFLLDTGAYISVINARYEEFVKRLTPKDAIEIQYGNGKRKSCPVFNIGIIIQGTEFDVDVAYDNTCPYLVLGHYKFFDHNTHNIFDTSLKKTRLIRN